MRPSSGNLTVVRRPGSRCRPTSRRCSRPQANCRRGGDEYAFEYKWDGVRAIAFVDAGGVTLHSRNQIDITFKYPEIQPLARALGRRRVILDGEIVTLDDAGRPSFLRLQQRMQVSSGPRSRA
jgi:ATP-dependent DNA ligase